MPTVKYDVSDVESGSSEAIKAGMYEAAITEASYGKSNNGNNMFTLVLTITKGDYKGRKLWHYILPEQAEFRMREFTDALELAPKGAINTDKIVGTVVGIRTIIRKSEEFGEQAKVKNLLPPEVSGGGDEAEEEAPYTEWEQSELADEIAARELTVTGRKTVGKMVAALEADDEANPDEGEESEEAEEAEEAEESEEAEEGEEELTLEDLEGMSRADLKALIKEEELEVKVLKKDSDDDLREKIAEALELEAAEDEAEEEDEEEAEEGEEVDYSTWEVAALKAELQQRGLKPDGRKSILAARLKKDDESGEDPF